jgi:hypothetical protein
LQERAYDLIKQLEAQATAAAALLEALNGTLGELERASVKLGVETEAYQQKAPEDLAKVGDAKNRLPAPNLTHFSGFASPVVAAVAASSSAAASAGACCCCCLLRPLVPTQKVMLLSDLSSFFSLGSRDIPAQSLL